MALPLPLAANPATSKIPPTQRASRLVITLSSRATMEIGSNHIYTMMRG
jgi:hypothetical protein